MFSRFLKEAFEHLGPNLPAVKRKMKVRGTNGLGPESLGQVIKAGMIAAGKQDDPGAWVMPPYPSQCKIGILYLVVYGHEEGYLFHYCCSAKGTARLAAGFSQRSFTIPFLDVILHRSSLDEFLESFRRRITVSILVMCLLVVLTPFTTSFKKTTILLPSWAWAGVSVEDAKKLNKSLKLSLETGRKLPRVVLS